MSLGGAFETGIARLHLGPDDLIGRLRDEDLAEGQPQPSMTRPPFPSYTWSTRHPFRTTADPQSLKEETIAFDKKLYSLDRGVAEP